MQVAALYYYPIKSCGAIEVQAAPLDKCGIRHDRQFLLIDPDGTYLSQREYPRMALVRPQVDERQLTLLGPGMSPLSIDICQTGKVRPVRIFRDTCEAIDQGDAVAKWFSGYLGSPCRLVTMAPQFARRVNPVFASNPEDQVNFADAYPFLLATEASLDDLNARLAEPLPMNRFRPNIVVAGATAYAEDTWKTLSIGAVEFVVAKACVRCVVTTTNQATAERGAEPLRTLATYRNLTGDGVFFGQNLIHVSEGEIRVGDPVVVSRFG